MSTEAASSPDCWPVVAVDAAAGAGDAARGVVNHSRLMALYY